MNEIFSWFLLGGMLYFTHLYSKGGEGERERGGERERVREKEEEI